MNNQDIIKCKLGDLDINDSFFDSLKEDYPEFLAWFDTNKNRYGYIYMINQKIYGLLILKHELKENCSDIEPKMSNKPKLKICTLKVDIHGIKLGDKFMNIVLEEATKYNINEIYITLYDTKKDLIKMLENYNFKKFGLKNNELVYLKKLER